VILHYVNSGLTLTFTI